MNIALLIAGGSGARMHQNIPKQFLTVNERPVIVYTLEAFQHHPEIDEIAVVCIEGWESVLWAYANQFNITKLKYVVPGGKNGQDSIRNGVFELEKHHSPDDIVLIHDAIRPMVSAEIISDCIRVTQLHGNAITVIPCAEAMMQTEDGVVSTGSYPRDNLKRTQTPQGFPIGKICDLHRRALKAGITNSVASCTLMIEMGEMRSYNYVADCAAALLSVLIPCTRELTKQEVMEDYETNTGKVIIETIENGNYDPMAVPGIVVKNHGPFAWGKSPANAVYNAVVMEKVAEMDLKTLLLNPDSSMAQYVLDKHYMRKHGPNAYYGQK